MAPTSWPLLFLSKTLTLSLPPCLLLHLSFCPNLSGRSGKNCLLPPLALSGYNGSDTRFFQGSTRLMSWPDGKRCSCLLQSPCSLSPLISCIHSGLFWDWRRTVLSKFFNTQVPSISTEELVLSRHARCNGHSLLSSSDLSRIGRIENPSCSTCGHPSQDTFHLILHCPATDS